MADWRGEDTTTADRYRDMARFGYSGSSPIMERLALGVADDPEVLALIGDLPTPKQQPNLVFGAARWLDAPLDSYAAFRPWLLSHWAEVESIARVRRTQTNEVRRLATLLPVFPTGPLAIVEVGASAGLCLYPDRYRYSYEPGGVVGSSGPLLTCATHGPVPIPADVPDVVWRAGLDLSPLDVTSDDDVSWLRALVWPEQTERLTRLDEAVAVARADPPRIVTGDLLSDLEPLLDDAPADATLVVFHSAVLAYVDAPGRAAFASTICRLNDTRGVVWIANEAPGIVPNSNVDVADQPRFVISRNAAPVALGGQHGSSLDWLE